MMAAPTELASLVNKWSQTVDDEYLFGVNPDRTMFFAWHTTGGDVPQTAAFGLANSSGTVPLNALTHVALVRDGATLTFYVGGVADPVLTVMDGNPFRNGINSLRVGGQARTMNRFFNGGIDQVRIYNRALTAGEIQTDMTTPVSVDGTPPALSGTAASAITGSGATIGWTTNEASDSQVDYGTTTSYGSVSALSASPVTTHAINLAALSANTTYHFRARSNDAAGNTAVSGDFTFTTLAADVAAPVVTGAAVSAVTSGGGTFTWATTEAADSEVEYGGTAAYGSFSTLDANRVTSHTMAVSGLASSTLYHFRVRSRDAAGNLGVSGDLTFTTLEGTPPSVAITSPAGSAIVSGTIVITASATDNVGVVGVQFRVDGAPLGAEDTTAPYSVSWNTATASAGMPVLTAVARDAAGNRTTSTPVAVTIQTANVTLAWDANSEPDVAGYTVYFGTAPGGYSTSIDLGNITTYVVSGLGAGSMYYFAVSAYTAAGAESAVSNEVSAAR
jgi:hypothetical protein